jgi:hypothetical protein
MIALAAGVAIGVMSVPAGASQQTNGKQVQAVAGPLADGPVDGFGADLPLSEVVHDIVPAGVKIVYDRKVNQTQLVSWAGGPSWEGALTAALAPAGLTVTFTDQGVSIDVPIKILTFRTIPHTPLRVQVRMFIEQANAEGCGDPPLDRCYTLFDPAPDAPEEPWMVQVADHFEGQLPGALTWLREGFWRTPRPDIGITQNNVVILSFLGEPR